jgi:hypothetical protein
MSQPLLYDPRYHTFESWASLMCEQYAANQLEIPTSIKPTGSCGATDLKSIDIFTNEAVPDTDNYQNWYDWAEALLAAINPRVA